MIMESSPCLYHSDKNEFLTIQKELQNFGWLPRKCAHRLAMAVCSCRKNKGPLPESGLLLSYKETLEKILEKQRSILPKSLIMLIEKCLNTGTASDYSLGQMFTILVKAKHGDYSMLSRATLSTNSKLSEKELQRSINRNKKLTPSQVEIIISKKKKKLKSDLIKLPVFPGNFPKMKTDFVKENKGFIQLQYDLNNQSFAENKIETYVKVWGDPANLKTLNQRLIEEAKVVQKQVDNERRVRKERKAERRHYYTCLYENMEEDFQDTVILGNVKEHLFNDFSLKAHRTAKNKSKAAQMKVQTSVLDGGHCLQCFKSFTDLHLDKTHCTFHKGYAILDALSNKRLWSCCSLEVEEDLDAYTAHSTTGCTNSTAHNWRTHAKAKGKVKENELYMSQRYQ